MIAPTLSALAAAQSGGQQARTGPLDLPGNVQFVGQQNPGIRKATAIVNGEVITGSDVAQRMALITVPNQIQPPPEEVERFRAQVLRYLIDEAIQIQAAQQQELSIEDREVNQYYRLLADDSRRTPEGYSAFLRSIGSSERSMKRQIRGELAWQRLQRRNVENFASVGDDEVRAVMARLGAQRSTTEYHVAEISLSAAPETAAEAQANVARIVQQIRAGASFAALARQHSEATTAAVGGDLGWVQLGQLSPEIGAIITQMPVGGVSDPIANPGGYSIVALFDSRRQILVPDPRDAELSLLQMTATLPAGTTPAHAEARVERLGREAQAMGGCGGAPAAAGGLDAELISNDTVRVRELPPAFQQMLLSLNVGQATPAFGSAERISVLVLCGRDDPPPVNVPNADTSYSETNRRRVAALAQRYLQDLRRSAVIDYR